MAETKLDILINAAVNGVDQIKSLSKEITDVNSNVAQTAQITASSNPVIEDFFNSFRVFGESVSSQFTTSISSTNTAIDKSTVASLGATAAIKPLTQALKESSVNGVENVSFFSALTDSVSKFQGQILLATAALGGYLAVNSISASQKAAEEYNALSKELYDVGLAVGFTSDQTKKYEQDLIKTGLTTKQAKEQLKAYFQSQLDSGLVSGEWTKSVESFVGATEKQYKSLKEIEDEYSDEKSIEKIREKQIDILEFNRANLSIYTTVEQKQALIAAQQAELLSSVGQTFLPMKKAIDESYKSSLDIIANFLIEVNKVVEEFDKQGEFANILGSMFKESSVILQGVSDVLLGVIRYVGSAGNEFVTMAKAFNHIFTDIKKSLTSFLIETKETISNVFGFIVETISTIDLSFVTNSFNSFIETLKSISDFNGGSIIDFFSGLKDYIPTFSDILNYIEEMGTGIRDFGGSVEWLGLLFKDISWILDLFSQVAPLFSNLGFLASPLSSVFSVLGDAILMVSSGLDKTGESIEGVEGAFNTVSSYISEISNSIKEWFSSLSTGGEVFSTDLITPITNGLQYLKETIVSTLLNAKEIFFDVFGGVISYIESFGTYIREAGESFIWWGELFKDISILLGGFSVVIGAIRDGVRLILDIIYKPIELILSLYESLYEFFGLSTEGFDKLRANLETAKEAITSPLTYVEGKLDSTSQSLDRLGTASIGIGKAMTSVGSSLENTGESIGGIFDGLTNFIKGFDAKDNPFVSWINDFGYVLGSESIQDWSKDFISGFDAVKENINSFVSDAGEFFNNLSGFFQDLIGKSGLIAEAFKFVSENGSFLGAVMFSLSLAAKGVQDGFNLVLGGISYLASKALFFVSLITEGIGKIIGFISKDAEAAIRNFSIKMQEISADAEKNAIAITKPIMEGTGAVQQFIQGMDDASTVVANANPNYRKLEDSVARVAGEWQAGTLAADDFQDKLNGLTESVTKAGKEGKITADETKKLNDAISKIESTETDRFNKAMEGMKVSIREVATTAEDGENKTVEFLDATGLAATKYGKAIKDAIHNFADNLETVAVSAKGTEEIFRQAFSKGLDTSKTIMDLSKFNGALDQAQKRGFEVGESLDLLRGRFYGLLDNTLKTAKTTEDFEQVRVALTNMRNTGVISATDLTNAQEKLRVKIKEVADETKNADISSALKELGTSYQEFSTGISDAAAKRSAAMQQLVRGLADKTKAEIEAKEATEESTESEDDATESEEKEAEAVEKTTEKVKEKTKETEKATEKEKEKSDAVVDGTNKEVAAIEKQIKETKDRVAVTNEEIEAKNREIAIYERLKKAKEEQIELDKQSLDDAKSLVASENIFGGKDFSFTTETSGDISSEKTIKDWDNIENKVLSLNNVLNTTKDTIKQTTTAISEFANPQPFNLFEQNTSNKLKGVSVVFKETVGELPNVFNREVDNLEQTVTDFVRQTSVTGKTNQAIQGFFNAIKEGATNSGEAIKGGLSTAFETLNDTILDKELAVFDDFFEEISDKAEKEANLLISAFAGLSDVKALEEIADDAEEGTDNIKEQVESVKELTNENKQLAAIQKVIKDNKPNVEQATGGNLAGQSEYNQGQPDWAKRLLAINEQVKSGKSIVNEVAGTTEFVGGDQGARLTQLDDEFKAIAKARKEADALYEILNKEINTAKTLEELGNVNKQILEAKESGTLFGEALTGALQQVTLKFDSLLESQLKNAKTKEDYDILTRKVQELGSTGTITGQQMALAFDKIKEKQTGAREETLRNSQQMTELASASARLNSATIASRKAEIDIEKAKQTVIAAEEKVRKNGTEASKAELAVAKANLELVEERGRLSAIKYREELANMDLVKAKQTQINAEKARALNPADVNLNAAVDAANREVEARQLVVENIKQAVIAQEQLVAQTELGVAEAQQLAAANAEAAGAAKSEQPAQGGGGGGGSFAYTTRTSFQKQIEEITGQKDTGQYEQIFQGSANKDGGFWNIGEGAARQALAVKTLEEVKQKTEENKKAAEEMATAYEKSKSEINQAKDGVSLLTESQANALGLSKEMAESYNKIRQDAMNLYKESEGSFKSFSKSMVDIANESSDQERSQIDLIKEKTEQRKQDLALSKQELDLKLQLALVSAKAAGLTDQEAAISKMMQKTNDQYAQALGNLDKIAAKEIETGKNKEFIERDKLQGEIDAREFERAKKKNEEKEKLEKARIDDVRKREDQMLNAPGTLKSSLTKTVQNENEAAEVSLKKAKEREDKLKEISDNDSRNRSEHLNNQRKREDQLLEEQGKKLATVQKERMDKELAMRTSILDIEKQKRKEIEDATKANEDSAFVAVINRINLEKASRLELLNLDKQRAFQDLDIYEKKRRIELEERRNEIESRSALLLSQATGEPERIKIESDKKAALLDLDKKGVELSEAAIERKKAAEEKARSAELAEKEKQSVEEKRLADQQAVIELQRQERAKKELEDQRILALQFEDEKRKLEKLKQDEDLAFQKQKDVLLEERRKNDLEFEQKKQSQIQDNVKKEAEEKKVEELRAEEARKKAEKLKAEAEAAQKQKQDELIKRRNKEDLEFEQKKQAAQRAFDAEREYRALKLKAIESGVNLGTIEDIKKSAGGDLSKMVESGDSKASEAYSDKLYKIQELIDQKMMSKLQSFSPPKAEMDKAATRGESNLGSFAKSDVVELNLNLGGQRITTYAPKEQSNGNNVMDSLHQFRMQTA